jgi:serine/threonine protein kinase
MSWNRFQKLQTLGYGAYGTVYLAKDLQPEDDADAFVAVKCVPLADVGEREKQMAMGEVAILRQLEHRNILRFIECFIDEDSFLCTVTEFVDGGDLAAFQRKAMENSNGIIDALVVADLAEQILEGLAYLHSNHVLHRDVKPNNFYITKGGVLKIGDFGVSKLLSASVPNAATFIGTPFYMAPEVCLGEQYSYAADVWSFGVVVYELYCGKLPFTASNVLALIHAVTEGKYDHKTLESRPYSSATATTSLGEELQQDICRLISSLVRTCLTLDPMERPRAVDLLTEYFRKGDGSAWVTDDFAEPSTEEWAEQPLATEPAPAWMENMTRLSEMPVTEPPRGPSRNLSPGDTVSPMRSKSPVSPNRNIYVDPKELESKIREKALILHRRRLELERRRRTLEQAEQEKRRVERVAQELERRRQAEKECAPPVVGRIVLPGPVSPEKYKSPFATAREQGSERLRDSLRQIAQAIVAQDPTRRTAAALLGNPGDGDDDDDDLPLNVSVLTEDRVVPVKLKRGTSYKKMLRKLRKALGLEPADEIAGSLTFHDSDGDEIEIAGKREWNHAVEDHVQRGAECLVLRLTAA